MYTPNRLLVLASLGLSSVLAGCDGATITVTPNNTATNSSAVQISSESVVQSSSAQVQSSSAQAQSSLVVSVSSSAAFSSAAVSSSSSEDCSQYPGAPACYAITDTTCTFGNCEPEYRVLDACGVSHLPQGQVASFISAGSSNCHAPIQSTCSQLDGRTYFSDTLGETGRSENGLAMGHWRISFNNGQLTLLQSDFGLTGTYSCQNGQVLATIDHGSKEEHILAFSEDLSGFAFNPLGGDNLWYAYHGDIKPTQACEFVRGNTYSNNYPTDNNDPLRISLPGAPETLLTFNASPNTVDYLYFGDIATNGHFVCDLGKLELHLADRKGPVEVHVIDDGKRVIIEGKTLQQVDVQGPCPADAPGVCAAVDSGIRCVTTPCPSQIHQTFTNTCTAKNANATVLFETPCGKLEGTPVNEEPVFCTQQYDPVCAAKHVEIQCVTTPCPSAVHQTYGNACEANAAKSPILFTGECGKLEGQFVEEQPVICPANYAPICAKAKAAIACIKAPCPTHEYKTFSNACVATANKAQFSFEGQCSTFEMENLVTFEHEPARLTKELAPSMAQPIKGHIDGHIATITWGYSGCNTQDIHLSFSTSFKESSPVQASVSGVKTIEDLCQAYFETTQQYDLLPLKGAFQNAYPKAEGVVVIPNVGTYRF